MYQTIVQAVRAHAQETPDKLAVAFKKERLTYAQLAERMENMAGILAEEYQVRRGDLVMLSSVSKPEYIAAYLAIQCLGAVSVPVDKGGKTENILDVYAYTSPRLLLADRPILKEEVRCASLKGLYDQAALEGAEKAGPAERGDDELAEILFTTGTTGRPKGTMLTVGNICASMHNTWHGVGMEGSDVVLIPLPLNHSLGMRVARTVLYIGAAMVLQNGFTFARELENNIAAFGCTGFVSVPASLEVVCRQLQDKLADVLGRLRYMEIGAGSLGTDMKKKLLRLLPDTKIVNTWGSTETGGAIFLTLPEQQDKLSSLGKPVASVELRTVNEKGEAIAARDMDSAGRMALRGPMQMKGYYQMPKESAAALVDGWLYTNDLVYLDGDGFVYMLGRADDIINVGGEKVSPLEVENLAQEYEQIRECACIGVDDPDGILGKVPALYVVPAGAQFDEDGLKKFLADKMERYKIPQIFVTIRELPRNRMKKLDRKALYRLWEENGDDRRMNAVVSNILGRRSIREFTDREISRNDLEMILQCGYYAPSGHNMQTWRFTVVQDPERIAALRETASEAAREKKVHFYGWNNPKVLILVSNDRRNADGIQDSACAAQNMMLAASSYGIGSVWLNPLMTLCDVPQVRSFLQGLKIPDSHIVWATLAFGYPAAGGKLLAKKTNVVQWF